MWRAALVFSFATCSAAVAIANPIVRFATPLGDFDVELCETTSALCTGAASGAVANFLRYVDDGDYAGSFVHRSVASSVIQGGGYKVSGGSMVAIPEDAPIPAEINQSNLRGTLAMARRALPDTATNQWFVNVVDNTELDTLDGGFSVFGQVLAGGMEVVDAINALPAWNLGPGLSGPFSRLPLAADFDGTLPDVIPSLIGTEISRIPEPGPSLLITAGLAWLGIAGPKRRA